MSTNGVPEVLKSKGVSAETVKALSAFKDEPGWLTEKRLSAWRTFEKTPMPSLRDEAWRYTDISDVRIEDFLPYAPSPDVTSEGDLPDAVQRLIKEGEENSALLVQHNSETTFVRVDEELSRRGVVFTDLHTALREHEDLVREHLFELVPVDYDKVAALSAAAFSGGSFLYVPRGVDVEVPIQSYRWLDVADSSQVLDHHTLQDHIAPNAHSDLLYKGALRDESLAVFSGLIRVEPGAQKTDAYQTNRNLILGTDEAMAVSLPNLEIMADDVKCSHGSTTGQVDDVELFYLMSRGIPRAEAEKLVVFGFFGEVTSRIPLQGLKEKLDRAIEGKIGLGFEERAA